VLIWLISAAITSIRFATSLPQDWSIAACDVGQGDALVLRSNDQIALIDVGRHPQKVARCLEQLNIDRINLLVLTHFDKDHVGGLDAVIGKVERAVVGKPENSEDQSLLSELSRSGAQLERGTQGLTGDLGQAKWLVLWPDGLHPSMEMGNPGSVTLYVSFPFFNSIFLGDLGKESQLALMNSVNLSEIDVVKVAHHGSADQSISFYQDLSPSIGIFSVGTENEYGHPRQEALDMLTKLGAITPRTDTDGLILLSSTPSGLSVWTER
jgi:competence protein ComEC